MAGSAKSSVSRKSATLPRAAQVRPHVPVRAPSPVPNPMEMQQRLGNRGAMAFAERSLARQDSQDPSASPEERDSDIAGPEPGPTAARDERRLVPAVAAPIPEISESGEAPKAPLETARQPTKAAVDRKADEPVAEAPTPDEVAKPQEKVATEAEGEKTSAEGKSAAEPTAPTAGPEPMAGGTDASVTPPAATVSIKADSPGGVIKQLVDAPPTQSMQAYGQATAASGEVLKKQTDEAQGELPAVPAPTGISPTSLTDVVKAELAKAERPPQKLEGDQSGRDTPMYPTGVDPGPPAPAPAPTVLRGSDESDTEGGDRELSLSAQNALNSIRIFTGEIPSSAGPRPGVDMTGEADPSQMQNFQQSSDSKVGDAVSTAREDTSKDFGEHDIFPPETEEILKSERKLGTRAAGGEAIDGLQMPADISSALDKSTGPIYREKMDAKHDEYRVGEEDYTRDSKAAHEGAQRDIGNLEEATRNEQMQHREGAQDLVAGYRQEWRDSIDSIDDEYRGKAEKARAKHRGDIDKKRTEGETKAKGHLEHAEKEAARKERKAKEDVRREKAKKRKKSGGFWGWAKRAASALVDALKSAVNFIYDTLRKAVKGLFELAKKLALAAIELVRMAIVGLITAFGAVLKGLVTIALIAFPDEAKKAREKIDGAVDTAVSAVNTAADMLKKGVAAIIDFLANTIDSLLGLIQSIYNGIFTVIGMLIRGEFKELMERIGSLVEAAKQMPPHLEGSVWEQLLGVDISKAMPDETAAMPTDALGTPATKAMAETGLIDSDVVVDPISTEALDPELVRDLALEDGEERLLGERSGESYGLAGIAADFADAKAGTARSTSPTPTATEDAGKAPAPKPKVSRSENAAKIWKQMKSFMGQWLKDNWGKLLLAVIGALVGVIALTIVTGGAILAALPIIMKIVTAIFIGLALMKAMGYLKTYLSEGWAKKVGIAAKALANALAVGIVELAMALGFRALGVALKGTAKGVAAGTRLAATGVRTGTKAAASGVKQLLKSGKTLVSKSGSFMIRKGRLVFVGLRSGFSKGVKKVKELVARVFKRFRIKKITAERRGRRLLIWGHFNPKVIFYDGEIWEVRAKRGEGRLKPHDRALVEEPGKRARTGIVMKKEVAAYLEGLTDSQRRTAYKNLRDWRKVHPKKDLELHHIATNKNFKLGKQWSKRFESIFKKGGRTLDDKVNKVLLPSHSGPHTNAYHQWVFDRLQMATKAAAGKGKAAIGAAIDKELKAMAKELLNDPRKLWP